MPTVFAMSGSEQQEQQPMVAIPAIAYAVQQTLKDVLGAAGWLLIGYGAGTKSIKWAGIGAVMALSRRM